MHLKKAATCPCGGCQGGTRQACHFLKVYLLHAHPDFFSNDPPPYPYAMVRGPRCGPGIEGRGAGESPLTALPVSSKMARLPMAWRRRCSDGVSISLRQVR